MGALGRQEEVVLIMLLDFGWALFV
jgi:hypothetical protein